MVRHKYVLYKHQYVTTAQHNVSAQENRRPLGLTTQRVARGSQRPAAFSGCFGK